MKIEIPIKEIQEYLGRRYDLKVALANTEKNKIKINYYTSMVLTIKEVKDQEVVFQYETGGLTNFLAKLAHSFLDKKLDHLNIEYDPQTNEVRVDLKKFRELDGIFKYLSIKEIQIIDDNISLFLILKKHFRDTLNE